MESLSKESQFFSTSMFAVLAILTPSVPRYGVKSGQGLFFQYKLVIISLWASENIVE